MMGARDEHTLRVFLEAEQYQGPSIIMAYSHCIAHGFDLGKGMQNQKAAVAAGQWLLYRYHPDWAAEGKNPLRLDSPAPKIAVEDYLKMENRFRMLAKSNPDEAGQMFKNAQEFVDKRRKFYEYLSAWKPDPKIQADAAQPGNAESQANAAATAPSQ